MEDWAGTDFSMDEDMHVTHHGDYVLRTGRENVDAAVKRRLTTPLGALFYDDTYGNRVFDRLGDTMDQKFVTESQQDISECLSYEDRIVVVDIQVLLLNEERRAQFIVAYQYNDGTDDVQTMEGVITDDGLYIP